MRSVAALLLVVVGVSGCGLVEEPGVLTAQVCRQTQVNLQNPGRAGASMLRAWRLRLVECEAAGLLRRVEVEP